MTYVLVAPPAVEPLTLDETRAFLRLDTDAEDALVASLIATARQHLERETGLCLVSQKWRLCRDAWPADGRLRFARAPLVSIEAITLYAADGTPSQLTLEGHILEGRADPPRLWLARRPCAGRAVNGIEVDFTAGYGVAAADVPAPLRQALLLHVAHMHAFRGVLAPEEQPAGIPPGYERLLAPLRLRGL